jgi:cell pole-organizing protein PopZ
MGQIDNIAPAADPSMEDILASIRRILADGEEGGEQGVGEQGVGEQGVGEVGTEIQASGSSDPGGSSATSPRDPSVVVGPRGPVETPAEPPAHEPAETPPPGGEATGAAVGGEATGVAPDVFVLDQSMLIEEPATMQDHNEQPPHDYSHLDAGELPAAPLLAAGAAAAATASLGALARVVSQRQTQVYRNGPTLEDMVREEIRPLVKGWLDENLAPMVERLVRAEIQRVTGTSK